ncbi:MAG: hypothetical protein MK132_09690 [Lentisphaerales bacterium]|nr:hypothetical protein [Lentisphaerales bacterium]
MNSESDYKEAALRHVKRCFELTEENKDKVKDFDIAYSIELRARDQAINKEFKEAKIYYQMALDEAKKIGKKEDRKFFLSDLKSGN